MTDLGVKIPVSYDLYNQYLSELKTFYDILANKQYEVKVMPNRTIFYKDLKKPNWVKIIPPKFLDRDEAIDQWQADRQQLVDLAQQQQFASFFKFADKITEDVVTNYNQIVNQIEVIDKKIDDIKGFDMGDINQKIKSFNEQRYKILGGVEGFDDDDSLSRLLEARQANYTFKGDTLAEYESWKAQWIQSQEYANWQNYNKLYYQQLLKLHQIDEAMVEYLKLQKKLEDFAEYRMVTSPVYDPHSSGPTSFVSTQMVAPSPKAKIGIKPKLIPTPVAEPAPTLVAEPVPTPVAESAPTPLSPKKVPLKAKVPLVPKLPDMLPPEEVPQPQPIEEEPTPEQMVKKVLTKKDVKESKAQNLAIIDQAIKELGKPELISKLKPSTIGAIAKLMLAANIKDDFPAVRTYLTGLKKDNNADYNAMIETGIHTMTAAKLMTQVYKKIRETKSS